MGTYVLVHGMWHGGWCWKRLARLLRTNGHEVYVPTLTGLGERAHLASREVDLTTHIEDVRAVLEYEDLYEVVLVGHSYAGIVIRGVADVASWRVRHLVYLDAIVPEDGQSVEDIEGEHFRAEWAERARAGGEGWRVPPSPPERWGIQDARDLDWMRPRLADQPWRTLKEPVRLKNPAAEALPRTYIYCTDRPAGAPNPGFLERIRGEPGWTFRDLDTGHEAMITAPEPLAGLLVQLT